MTSEQKVRAFMNAFQRKNVAWMQEIHAILTEIDLCWIYSKISGKDFQYLIDIGVNPPPYAIAATFCHRPKDAEYWFSMGIDLNIVCESWTPLTAAIRSKSYDLAKRLINQGVDVNAFAKDEEQTALYALVNQESHVPLDVLTEMVTLLFEHGADANIKCANGLIPFIHSERIEVLQQLRPHTSDVNACDIYGKNALCRNCLPAETVRYLIDEGVDVNKADRFSETPLSSQWCDVDSFRALLDAGAKVTLSIINRYNRNDFHVKDERLDNMRAIRELLRERGYFE